MSCKKVKELPHLDRFPYVPFSFYFQTKLDLCEYTKYGNGRFYNTTKYKANSIRIPEWWSPHADNNSAIHTKNKNKELNENELVDKSYTLRQGDFSYQSKLSKKAEEYYIPNKEHSKFYEAKKNGRTLSELKIKRKKETL